MRVFKHDRNNGCYSLKLSNHDGVRFFQLFCIGRPTVGDILLIEDKPKNGQNQLVIYQILKIDEGDQGKPYGDDVPEYRCYSGIVEDVNLLNLWTEDIYKAVANEGYPARIQDIKKKGQ